MLYNCTIIIIVIIVVIIIIIIFIIIIIIIFIIQYKIKLTLSENFFQILSKNFKIGYKFVVLRLQTCKVGLTTEVG